MKRMLCAMLLLALCFGLCSCGKNDPYADMPNPIATITMNDGSVLRFELQYAAAPNTVCNFVQLANSGFYDGLKFFRVVPGVLIQSGDPNNDGTGDAGYTIAAELSNDGLSHNRGVISMARKSDLNSASSQFFIMQGNYPEYDGSYVAFGTALDEETLTAIDAIATQPVDGYYCPLREQVIQSVRVNTHGYELPEAKVVLIPQEENQ